MTFSQYYWQFVKTGINVSTSCWDKIVLKHKMPFIKKSIFWDLKQEKHAKEHYKDIIKLVSKYPSDLITKYIKRMS